MKFKKTLLGAVVGGLAFLGSANDSRANSINILLDSSVSPNPAPVVGGRDFSYSVELTSGNEVRTGNFFTLYDFQGLSGISTSDFTLANGWVFSSLGAGIAPPNYIGDPASVDNPALPNITFTYVGVTPIQSTDPGGAPLVLGKFTATTSVATGTVLDNYVAQDYRSSDGMLSLGNTGQVLVPFNANGPFLPLPATACGGLGLMGLLVSGRRRRSA
jgi:hypothetical protein